MTTHATERSHLHPTIDKAMAEEHSFVANDCSDAIPAQLFVKETYHALARIDLAEGKAADYRRTIGEVVYDTVVEILKAPKDDRFQVITEHPAQDFIFDPT